jgi:hypothetical protein
MLLMTALLPLLMVDMMMISAKKKMCTGLANKYWTIHHYALGLVRVRSRISTTICTIFWKSSKTALS